MEENTNYYSTENSGVTEEDLLVKGEGSYNSPYIYGWNNDYEVAMSVWSSIHGSLLSGELVFAYRPSSKKGNKLIQIVIVRNFTIDNMTGAKIYGDYGIGYITSGYTALLPHVPHRYLEDEMSGYLDEWGVDKKILNTYKAIIEDLKEK